MRPQGGFVAGAQNRAANARPRGVARDKHASRETGTTPCRCDMAGRRGGRGSTGEHASKSRGKKGLKKKRRARNNKRA